MLRLGREGLGGSMAVGGWIGSSSWAIEGAARLTGTVSMMIRMLAGLGELPKHGQPAQAFKLSDLTGPGGAPTWGEQPVTASDGTEPNKHQNWPFDRIDPTKLQHPLREPYPFRSISTQSSRRNVCHTSYAIRLPAHAPSDAPGARELLLSSRTCGVTSEV